MMIVNKMETLKGCFLDMGKASLQKLGSSVRTEEELDPPFSTKEWVEKKNLPNSTITSTCATLLPS